MQTVESILTQMGLAVVNSIWQMALIWILFKVLVAINNFRAATKFRLALSFTLTGTLFFLVSLGAGLFSANPGLTNSAIAPLESLLPGYIASEINLLLGATYLVILAFFIVKGKNEWSPIWHFKPSGSVKTPPSLRLFVDRYATWMEIPRKVTLAVSAADVPATFGWLKPVILLPAACIARLSTQQLEAILLHELAHIRRNDYLWGMLLYTSEKVLWFNPFLLNIVKEARQEAENACDDWVVQFEFSPREYAFALLQMAKSQPGQALTLAANGNNEFQLLGRIKRILGLPAARRQPGWKEILSGSFLVFFSFQLILFNAEQSKTGFVPSPGKFAAVTYEHGNQFWEQSLMQAKLTIFESAVGKNEAAQKDAPPGKKPSNSLARGKVQPAELMFDREYSGLEREESTAKVMLSAGWANEMHETNTDEAINIAWEEFEVLLEKLETLGKLEEEEWKKLTQYIAFHTEIKQAIYKDAVSLRDPLLTAVETSGQENTGDILLIVFDEETRTLAASLVNKQQFNDEYQIAEVATDEQQVIFLHKKAKNPSRIITL